MPALRSHDEFADHLDALDRADDAARQAADDAWSDRIGPTTPVYSSGALAFMEAAEAKRNRGEPLTFIDREWMALVDRDAADLKRRSGQPLTALDAAALAALVEGEAA